MAIQLLNSLFIQRGIAALVALLPLVLFPSLFNLYRLPKSTFLGLMVTLLVWLWFLLLAQQTKESARFPLILPISLYLFFSLLSLAQATNIYEGLFKLLKETTSISLFWISINHLKTRDGVEGVLLWIIPSGAIVSLIGIHQMFGGDIPALVRISGGPSSTFGNQNMAAQYLLFVLPVAYRFFLSKRDRHEELLLAICAAITTTTFVYTGTRAAWGGLLLATLVVAIVFQVKKKSHGASYLPPLTQRKKILIGGVFLFVVAMNWIPPYIVEGWNIKGQETALDQLHTMLAPAKEADSRLATWKNTLAMVEDHPLLGVGKGNFSIVYPLYATKRVRDPAFGVDSQHREAHNDFLAILAETGLLGLLSFLWMLLSLGWKVWRSLLGKRDPHWTTLIIALAISVLSLLGPVFFEFPFSHPVSTALFWLFAGMLWVSCEQNSEVNTAPRWQPSRLGCQILLAFLGLSLLLSASANLTFLRAEFHFSRGVREVNEGNPARGEKEIQRAVLFNPTSYDYLLILGVVHRRMGKHPESIMANLRSLSLHPNYINALNNLGLGLLAVGRLREAELAWTRFLEIWPYDGNGVRNRLGEIYSVQGLRDKAIIQFQESLRIDPGDKIAKERLEALLQNKTARK